jgi:putative tryptophan/tyrosine transport system substrate-binding protein
MASHIERRKFIFTLGGAAAAWPLAARAQQTGLSVVGWLRAGGPPPADDLVAFRQGLNELGYVEGRNVAIELRNSDRNDRLPVLASELVRHQVAAIFAHNIAAAVAARAATATIPIVFAIGGDPVRDGLVTSLSRPTGNLTGTTFFSGEVLPKRLELMRELVPTADVIAVLLNPDNPNLQTRLRDVQEAARKVGQQILVINAGSESDIDMAFATIVQQQAGALVVGDDPFFITHYEQIEALAARHAIPTSYSNSRVVRAGALMSYGGNVPDMIRAAGRYIGRILKGEKPADLPVLQPTKVEFAINVKTAKSLGLKIPESFLLRADEVIE